MFLYLLTYKMKTNLSISRLKNFSVSSPVIKRPYFLQVTEKDLQHEHKINKQSMELSRVLVDNFTTQMITFHCILCFCSTVVSPSIFPGTFLCCLWTLRNAILSPSCRGGIAPGPLLTIWVPKIIYS